MSQGGTNLPRVGGYNQAVVLDAIRTTGPVSRVELGPLTGLTNQTVSNVVRRLLAAGLVSESGHAPSSGGKRRTLLSPRPDGAYAVGVHLDPDAVRVALVNLVGDVVAGRRIRLDAPGDPVAVVRRAARAVRTLTDGARIDPARLLGTGVAAPGPVDTRSGAVVSPPNLPGWGRVPLREMFAEATGTPVALDNDATAAAIGERWAGGTTRAGSFLFVYLGTGVGAGVVQGGTVLHGDSGNAGEFAHMAVEPGPRPCSCGGDSCLGPYCKPAAVVADLYERHGDEAAAALGLTGTHAARRSDWRLLCRGVRHGDGAARDVVRRMAHRLGQAVWSAVNLLDIDSVVLGGEAVRGLEAYLCAEVGAVVAARRGRPGRTVTVEPSVIGESVGAVGAASLVLHGNYAPGWRMLTEPAL